MNKKYIATVEFTITSTKEEIIEMYDAGEHPTNKELKEEHERYMKETLDEIKDFTGMKGKIVKFTEV